MKDKDTPALLEESAPTLNKAPKPVILRAPHDYTLTAVALEHRAEELTKLAKKTGEEGYERESRIIAADAAAITMQILPQFQQQRALPLVTPEDLEKAVLSAVKVMVYRAFESLDDAKLKVPVEQIRRRRDALIDVLVEKVAAFSSEVATRAFDQGVAAREITAESLAVECIGTLRV